MIPPGSLPRTGSPRPRQRTPSPSGDAWTAFARRRLGKLVGLGACALALLLWGCQRSPSSEPSGADQESSPTRGTFPPRPAPPTASAPASPPATEEATPDGFELASVAGVAPTERGHAIVLRAGKRALPVFVGETEGLSIQLRLAGERFHRPLTHDLMDALLEELGGSIESVRVERFEDNVFYSVVVLAHQSQRHELDSRTSDAIALALGHQVPIFVRSAVLDATSVALDSLLPFTEPSTPDGSDDEPPSDEPPLEPGTVAL